MRKSETLTLWISVAAALFAVFLIYGYTQEKSSEMAKEYGSKTLVVTATEFIHEMQTVQENMVTLSPVPEKFVQPGAASSIEDVAGLVALSPIAKGEQILRNKVIKPGPETGLSLQISPGKRAITLPVDEIKGLSHLLKPGDRIDISAALDVGEGIAKERRVKTILQDVVILAAGKHIANELPRIYKETGGEGMWQNFRTENKFSSITVEVSPKDSQTLIFILSTNPGSLFFTLRHPSDNGSEKLSQVSMASIAGAGPKPKRKPANNPFK